MLKELCQYSSLVNTSASKFANIIVPRFKTDGLGDGEILWNFVQLSDAAEGSDDVDIEARSRSFAETVLDQNCQN